MKMFLSVILIISCVALGFVSCARAAVEKPSYTVVKKAHPFEVRTYPALVVAVTPMEVKDGKKDDSFMTLFGYIQGENAEKSKIAMTSPVLIEGAAGGRTMGFIVPSKVAAANVPQPTNREVKISPFAAGSFAVLRFPGRQSAANETKASEKLSAWMAANSLQAAGDPIFAYYDPPWTPVPFRRNEVLVRLKP